MVVSRLNQVQTWNYFMEDRFQIHSARKPCTRKAPLVLGEGFWNKIQTGQPGTHTLRNVKVHAAAMRNRSSTSTSRR